MKKEINIVKKTVLVVVLFVSAVLVAQANTNEAPKCDKKEFTVVALETLPAEVLANFNAVFSNQGVTGIKEVLQCNTSKNFKVVATNDEGAELTFFFDESGKHKECKENKE